MKQKIKLIFSIIILFAILIFTKGSFATTVDSINNQTPVFPQAYGTGTLYCKQKGGAVRFTQISPDYNEEIYNNTIAENIWPTVKEQIIKAIREQINKKLGELSEIARPIPSSSEQLKWYNGDFVQEEDEIIESDNVLYGAKVAMTPVWNTVSVTEVENNRTAYIFGAGPEGGPIHAGYEKGNYTETISDKSDKTAIQEALWNDPTYNEGTLHYDSKLYKEAYEYEKFYNENYKNGYNVSLNKDAVQVIVNQKEKTYVLGPYYLTYPDDRRFSYIENLTITTDTGYTAKPEVIFETKKTDKLYPSTGEPFFIKFNAEQANYPKKVGINVSFVYLENTRATYERLVGEGDIYQLAGSYNKSYSYTDQGGNDYYKITASCYIVKWGKYPAQRLAYEIANVEKIVGKKIKKKSTAKRDWTREELKANKDTMTDLKMELGGIVWEDVEGGKESIVNGKLDSTDPKENRIPNVPVSLYKEDGTFVASTRTNAEGVYRFKDLDPMFKYIVRFTYNGQYYQPTTYASSSTWGKEGWQTNSNATDIKSQRLEFNAKFASIGSSPENYTGTAGINRTYTKEQLLKAGIIDEFGNLISESNASMAQYVKDCMMDAYTGPGDGSYDKYPVPDLFVIDQKPVSKEYKRLIKDDPAILYPNAYYINLGLNPRPQSDLAIKKDIDNVTLEINGHTHKYTYDTLENKPNADEEWDINIRLSDAYYNTNYSRELYKEDYIYKASMYGDLKKSTDDELEVYITYKIMVRNQSLNINCKVDEIVDYYDTDLKYEPSRSYIQIKNGDNAGAYDVRAEGNSRYSANTNTTIDGYEKLYVRGLDDKYLTAGQTAYIYLTFKVNKETVDGENWIKLDEDKITGAAIGVGKENIVEINGYSTQYAKGTTVPNVGDVSFTPAGIVDRDSNPGNLNPSDVPKDGNINYAAFEDDTDKAPNMKLKLYRDDNAVRVISGNVWEDIRDVINNTDKTATANGEQNNNEPLINGVTVQLVELMENGTEFVWRTFEDGTGTANSTTPIINAYNLVENYNFGENHDGQYAFKSFAPGKYVVRFIYGDTIKTVAPDSLGGYNEKSYNGQDYKSTTYQADLKTDKTYTWREKSTWDKGLEKLGKKLTTVSTFKDDCSNNETANAKTDEKNAYLYDITASETKSNISDAKDIESRRNAVVTYSNEAVTNYKAEVLASHKVDYNPMNDRDTLLKDLMTNTQMTAETGLMVIELEKDRTGTTDQVVDNKTSYKIEHVDLGLEERPKAQLTLNKKVTNVKLTLANGSILFDAKQTADNVLWSRHKTYEVDYNKNKISGIRNNDKTKVGLVQLSMDEELMHGATVEISYEIAVSNVGEADYNENNFYYTGKVKDTNTIVTTRADRVLDYVANNLQFNANNNSNWKVISKEDIKAQGLVNSKLEEEIEKYNTIIVSEDLNSELLPELVNKELSATSVPLVLTQLITSENDTDDLTYRNISEIVETSNDVGRRMAYSVVGNQNPNPTEDPAEVDSDKAEVVKILPPFGNAGRSVVIATIILASVGITIVGIIFIKKKVLKK